MAAIQLDLAGAAALRDRDAEFLLEPLPLFDQERRRARRDEAQLRQVVAMRALFAVEQNIDRRRIAGRDGHAVIAQMLEKAAGGEFFRQNQRGAAIETQPAQGLRRIPAERAEIVKPVICRDAPAGGERIDIEQKFAKIQHHALGLRAGARREQDDGVVIGLRRLRRIARRATRQFGKQRIRLGLVPAPDPQPRRGRCGQKIVELQAVLIKNELRLQPRRKYCRAGCGSSRHGWCRASRRWP